MTPKVSIIIPVYNGANYLKEAIDSAIAQTYKNLEIIVINDGSDDDGATEKIAKSYGNKIKYYKKENGGVATALNIGIKKMTGDYFSWLSHDDMYDKNKIKYQIDYIETLGRSDVVVACNAKVLFENGLTQKEYINKKLFEYFDIFLSIAGDVGVNGCSLLIPREALIQSRGFNPNLPVTQDYDLWSRINKLYDFVLLEKNLVISRRHSSQDSVKKLDVCFKASDKLHYDFLNEIPYTRFEDYMDNGGANKAWSMYILYRNSGYVKTSSMILKFILEYYGRKNIDRQQSIIKSEIGELVSLVQDKEKKKKILFFSNVWTKGGIAKVLMYIFENLEKKYNIFLVTTDDDEYGEGYKLPAGISYVKIENDQNQNSRIMNILTYFDIDIFVGNPNFSSSFIDIYNLVKGSKIKTIAYNHGYYFLPYMYPHIYPTAIKIKDAYGSADAVIWLSQIACNLYNIHNSNGVYLPNPVEYNAAVKPKNKFNKKLLAVGRFNDEIKRIDRIFLIFKEILRRDSDYCLDIVGSCPMDFVLRDQGGKTIGEFLESLNIPAGKIKFWGEQDDVSEFYQKASILIMPSSCEGFCMVLTEALSFGVPCACSNYLGVEEIVQNEHNGWSSNDDAYLAKKIVEINNNPKKYSSMSRNALESVKKYSLDIFSDSWISLIELLVEKNSVCDFQKNRPIDKLSKEGYENIILGYENLLNDIANNYISKGQEQNNITNDTGSRTKRENFFDRLKLSLKRHGVGHTLKKLVFKILRKISSLLHR